jgi:hypothetical protein
MSFNFAVKLGNATIWQNLKAFILSEIAGREPLKGLKNFLEPAMFCHLAVLI